MESHVYFPYLYGRQSEFLALEDNLSHLGSPQKVFPVIEPVDDSRRLRRALDRFEDAGVAGYVIVNPYKHNLAQAVERNRWSAEMAPYLRKPDLVRPTFALTGTTTLTELKAFVAAHAGRKIGVSVVTAMIPPADVAQALQGADAIAFLHERANPSAYANAIGLASTVDVVDSFPLQARNADYAGEEWFTSGHQLAKAEGRPGFSDFTVLSGTFSATGGRAGAVAFHLTYEEQPGGSIWVQHFVSDETDRDVSDVTTKLGEAMRYLQREIMAHPTKFVRSPGLLAYLDQLARGTATNLPGSKRQQIAHHIYLVSSLV